MNQEDQNDRIDPELEARVAADVLGESSDLEHDQLLRLLEENSKLAARKKDFQRIDELLHEVGRGEFNVDDEEWKLPAKRRDAVLSTLRSETTEQGDGSAGSPMGLNTIPKHVFWSATRVTAVLSVVALCGVMVLTTYSFVSRVRTSQMVSESAQMTAAMDDVDAWYDAADSPAGDVRFAEGAEFEESATAFDSPAQPSDSGMTAGFGYQSGSKSALSEIRDSLAAAPQAAKSRPSRARSSSSDFYFENDASGEFPETPQLALPLAVTATAEAPAEQTKTRSLNGSFYKAELSSPSVAPPSLADTERARGSFGIEATEKWQSGAAKEAESDRTTWMLREPNSVSKGQDESAAPSHFDELSESADGYAGMSMRGDTQNGPQQRMAEKGLEERDFDGEPSAVPDSNSLALGIPQSGPEQEQVQGQTEARRLLRGGTTRRYSATLTESESVGQGIALDDRPGIGDTNGDDFAMSGKTMLGEAVNGDAGISSFSRINQDIAKMDQVRIAGKEVATKDNKPASSLEGLEALYEKQSESKRVDSRNRSTTPAGLNENNALEEAFSTFSLHVSDVSFKLAQAALQSGSWPDAAKVRIEEFVNAFDYGDPMPSQGEKVACRVEQSIHPFLQQRNLLRVSLRTAAAGRAASTPLRLTFLLDNSGSMERYDRQQTVRRAFALLAQQLNPTDQVTLISFARQPRLLADKVSGSQSQQLTALIDALPSEGGTNIEAALKLAFEKASEQQVDGAQNRIVLLTDGAVNLGDADPERLSNLITTIRDSGIAFDAAGICAEGLNDEVLEALTRNGDGRYYLLDSPESADDHFVRQIAGALRPSAKNVKVQIEFNPDRVGRYKLLGFEKHLLKQEDFRNDQVDAAEMAAAEAGVAVYQVEAKPDGEGEIGSVSVRFRDLSTGQMIENRWPIPYQADAPRPDQATPALRIATSAAMFAAKLRGEPLGEIVDLKSLSDLIAGLPEPSRHAKRVQQLQQMIQQARQISGN